MNGIAAFLAARLDEDEATARANIRAEPRSSNGLGDTEEFGPSWPDYETYSGTDELAAAYAYLDRFRPLRQLREFAAKRAILAEHGRIAESAARYPGPANAGALIAMQTAVRHLAVVYSDHPDYDQAWRP